MHYLSGELRKVISFKSKKDQEFFKVKLEMEHFDIEIFVIPKLYEKLEELKSHIGKQVLIPVYLRTKPSEDGSKVYQNFSMADLPQDFPLKQAS